MAKAAEMAMASNRTNTPKRKPKTAKSIFMAINHANPPKSKVKIKPGNLMDHEATLRKTSPI